MIGQKFTAVKQGEEIIQTFLISGPSFIVQLYNNITHLAKKQYNAIPYNTVDFYCVTHLAMGKASVR